jgi:hypothetical protein
MILYAIFITLSRTLRMNRSVKPKPVHHKFGDGNVDMMQLPEHY